MSLVRSKGTDSRIDNTAQLTSLVNIVVSEADAYTIAVTGTGSNLLTPPTGYTKIAGYTEYTNYGSLLTVVAGELVIGTLPVGNYFIVGTGYMDPSHSLNNSSVGVVFGLTRAAVTTYTPRAVHTVMPNTGNINNIAGNGTVVGVQSGDTIGVYLASDKTGTVTVHTSNIQFTLYKEL